MSSASVTNIPTGPQPSAQAQQQQATVGDDAVALRVADKALGLVASGKGGPFLTGALGGILAAVLAMAWHVNSEDRTLERRFDKQDRRIDHVEAQQDRILFTVEAIAHATGAKVPPLRVESRQ